MSHLLVRAILVAITEIANERNVALSLTIITINMHITAHHSKIRSTSECLKKFSNEVLQHMNNTHAYST